MNRTMYDFLIIGAIKSGTTTLHYLLAEHPQLSMPAEKEVPLFDRDVSAEEVAAHVQRYTGGKGAPLAGKATPRYMRVPGAAERIHDVGPDTKLIALVRDPIARARSHWRMRCQLGREHRAFAEVVADQLSDTERWRAGIEEDSYVACGEYGRIFDEYLSYFPVEQLLVLQTGDLNARPQDVLTRIWGFLGVDQHTPGNLGEQYNVSEGTQRRAGVGRVLWKVVPYDWATRVTGPRLQRRAGELLDTLRIARPVVTLDPSLTPDLQRALEEHYRRDASRVPSTFGIDVWRWETAAQ